MSSTDAADTTDTWDPQCAILRGCRFLLSQINRDPYSPLKGCFDRRYWAWKLIDFPEATFQRNLFPLAWLWNRERQNAQSDWDAKLLLDTISGGLRYTASIQHKNGSFDQAFPFEQSWGATAFLLYPLCRTLEFTSGALDGQTRSTAEKCLERAANFLINERETHGLICNHLAGGALGLITYGKFANNSAATQAGQRCLTQVLDAQHEEGWFPEYGGADPGYQTLGHYFLARINHIAPSPTLINALEKSAEFLSWFAFPDGSFGGEFGSRRTRLLYPGGFALCARMGGMNGALYDFSANNSASKNAVDLESVDMGNYAPVIENYIACAEAPIKQEAILNLPCDQASPQIDFPKAGLYIRSSATRYCVIGTSLGGVLYVFDRNSRKCIAADAGYVGQSKSGKQITTQATQLKAAVKSSESEISFSSKFHGMTHTHPTPFRFILLRLANLTVMRNLKLGNFVKSFLVRILVQAQEEFPLTLQRKISFNDQKILVNDEITGDGLTQLDRLEHGQRFVAVHMASANYFHPEDQAGSTENILNDKGAQAPTICRSSRY